MFTGSGGDSDGEFPLFWIFDPLTQDSNMHRVARCALYEIDASHGGDLTTATGIRCHLDIPLRISTIPRYFIGSLRQMRVAQDGLCGTILKDGADNVKSIIWSPHANSHADSIGFDLSLIHI